MRNLLCRAKNKVQGIATAVVKKDKGGKELIIEMGLTVIGVALLVVFRGQIKTLVDNIMSQATTTITGLFNFV